MSRFLHHWPLLVSLLVFFTLACPWLDRPGLHYDEALEAGVPALRLLRGEPAQALNGVSLRVGRYDLPLMVQNHIGAAQVYATVPFVALGGPTATALRAMGVLVGALLLLATYLLALVLEGRVAAGYSTALLACFGSFVFWARQGTFVTLLAALFAMAALAAGVWWWRSRRLGAALLVGVLFGLAAYSKLSALWLLNGAGGWWLLCWLASRRGANRARWWPEWRAIGVAALGFGLGAWPFLLYNLLSGGATLGVMERSARETYLGANNVDVAGNLVQRFRQFADVIVSGEHLWYLGATYTTWWALVGVVGALLVLLVSAIRGRWQRSLLLPFLALAVIAQSCYTISALWPTHFAVVVALPALLVGVALGRVHTWIAAASPARRAAWWHGAVAAVAALLLISQLTTSVRYLQIVRATGGMSFHSSAIYDVTRFLETRNQPVLALDWGLSAPISFLSGEAFPVEEFYGYEQQPTPELVATLRARIEQDGGRTLYLTHAENQEAFQRRAAFLQAVAEAGLQAEGVNVSVRADGWPMIEVWDVRDPGSIAAVFVIK